MDIVAQGASSAVGPGEEVAVCLQADAGEPVIVDTVKSVSFENFMAPLLGVPLVDELGVPLDGTTTVDTSQDGIVRLTAITVPRLYEYQDSSGAIVPVNAGVSMEGIVTFDYPNRRRNLQDAPEQLETRFRIKLDLAEPPDRTAFNNKVSAGGRSSPAALLVLLSIGLTCYSLVA